MLQIRLFGPLTVEQDGHSLPLPASAQARDLLAYLALFHARQHNRSALVGTFWPDLAEERARRALSQALWQIRRFFPDLVTAEAETVRFAPPASFRVDALDFERLAKAAFNAAPQETIRQELEQALALYRADFLEGNYADWALLERERLREFYLLALERLGQLEKSSGHYDRALDLALRLSGAEPLNEVAHREIMRLRHLLGQPEAALRQFELCCDILRRELEADPSPETLAVMAEINHLAEKKASENQTGRESLIPAPLVGREAERAALVGFLEGIFQGLGGLVLLEGEAGVGKTRLLQDIARDAEWRGAQVLWGSAREAQERKPFAPLAEALQSGLSPLRVTQVQQVVERIWLQTVFPLLSPHPALPAIEAAPPLPPAQEGARLVEAVARLLQGWAGITPLVLILEDLHWADQDTLAVLPALARQSNSCGVLAICSYRGEEARANPQVWEALQAVNRGRLLSQRVLSRLDGQATGELIRRSLGLASPAPLFEERLFRETDGNPLFILETLRALQDEGLLTRAENGTWATPWDETTADYAELPLPPVVEKVITHRLERLPAALRRPLEVVAALGSQFDFEALIATSGLDAPAALETARELIRRSFLRETPNGYRFEHDKIHQVAYEEIEADKRHLLHRKIAAYLLETRPTQLDALAWHSWRGESWEQAVRYNQEAGQAAMALHANREARLYLTRALGALDQLPPGSDPRPRADLLRAREAVDDRLGNRAAQKADLEALDALSAAPGERAQQALRWARYYDTVSDYPAAIRAAQQASELAGGENEQATQAAAQIIWGRALNMQAQAAQSQAILEQALENARAAGDARCQADCLHALARVHYDHQDRYEQALACCQAALGIVQALADRELEANLRQMMSNLFSDLGQVERAYQEKNAVLRLRREIGDRRGEAMILYSLAIYYRDRGDDDASLEHTRASLVIAEAIGDQRLEAYDRTYLGLLMEARDPHESLRQYSRALQIRRQIGQEALTVDTLAGLARACLQLGEVEEARAHIQEALDWVEAHGTFGVGDTCLVYLAAYEAFTAAGQEGQAAQVIRAAYDDLMKRAASLADEAARAQFLQNTPQHNKVLALYHRQRCRCIQARLPSSRDASQTVTVAWTLEAPEDAQVGDKTARRRHRLQRLLEEARAQGAAPTQRDLAKALGVGLRTIERDMAAVKK